jgi:hypothetical protein
MPTIQTKKNIYKKFVGVIYYPFLIFNIVASDWESVVVYIILWLSTLTLLDEL